MKQLTLLMMVLCAASRSNAQLASDKPLESVYSNAAKQKLQQPKTTGTMNAGLPSVAPLPKQVVAAQRNSRQPAVMASPAQVQKQLPSSRRTVTPVIHPPKKSNS